MLNPDFASGEAFIEAQMRDRCSIIRDRGGAMDDVLDETTGKLVQRPGSVTDVYTGICDIKAISRVEFLAEVGGHEQWQKRYHIFLPRRVDNVRQGDILEVDSIRPGGDTMLVGRRFKIHDVAKATNRVYRALDAVDMEFQVQVPD